MLLVITWWSHAKRVLAAAASLQATRPRLVLVVVLCFEQYPYEKKVLEGSQDESTHLRKSAPLLSPKISSGALGRDGRTSSNMALGGRMTLPLHNLGFVWTRVCPAKIQKGER